MICQTFRLLKTILKTQRFNKHFVRVKQFRQCIQQSQRWMQFFWHQIISSMHLTVKIKCNRSTYVFFFSLIFEKWKSYIFDVVFEFFDQWLKLYKLQLWKKFHEFFKNCNENDFKMIFNRRKREFRNFLKNQNVWMKKKTIFIIKTLINVVQRWFEWFENKFHFFFVFFSIEFMNKFSHEFLINKKFKQNRQCIRRFQHRMQFSTFHRK